MKRMMLVAEFLLAFFMFVSFVSADWYCPDVIPQAGNFPVGVYGSNPVDYFTRPVANYSITSYDSVTGNITLVIESRICNQSVWTHELPFNVAPYFSTMSYGFGNKSSVCTSNFPTGECGVSGYSGRLCYFYGWSQYGGSNLKWPSWVGWTPYPGQTLQVVQFGTNGLELNTESDSRCSSGVMWVAKRTISIKLSDYNNRLAGNGKGFSTGIRTGAFDTDGGLGDYYSYPSEFVNLSQYTLASSCPPGLVGYWPLNGNVSDVSGNGNNGINNGVTFVSGLGGQVGNFSGVNSYVNISGNNFNFERTQPFSACAWINTKNTSSVQNILGNNLASPSYRGWELALWNPSGTGSTLAFDLTSMFNSNEIRLWSTALVSANVWQHVCFTYNGSDVASGVNLYLNGNPINTTLILDDLSGTTVGDGNFLIGNNLDNTYPFSGSIAGVSVFNGTLSASEIQDLYNNGNGKDICAKPIVRSCDLNQTIMQLSSSTNALGALWNSSESSSTITFFNYSVCYSSIFGSNYTGNSSHDCTGSNRVISLSSAANAYAAVNNTADYPVDVCYGNLQCKNTEESCDVFGSNYRLVLKLFNETGSNISNSSDSSGSISICCSNIQVSGNSSWRDMSGTPISQADIGDTVKLKLDAAGISGNINYTIHKQCEGVWSCVTSFLLGNSVGQVSGSNIATWTTNDTGLYYFTAVVGGINFDSSGLNNGVLNITSPENNDNPVAVIANPTEMEKFVVNSNISFEQASTDADDDLNVVWDFGDGTTAAFSNCQTGVNCNATHSYNNSGVKVVSLTARESNRSGTDTTYRKILVYDNGINAMGDISSPANGGTFIGPIVINFSASDSFAANCTSSSCAVPSVPAGLASADCYNVSGIVGGSLVTYNCFDYPKDSLWINPVYDLQFNWTIRDTNGNDFGNIYGSWADNYSQVVDFSKTFTDQRQYLVKLKMGFENETS